MVWRWDCRQNIRRSNGRPLVKCVVLKGAGGIDVLTVNARLRSNPSAMAVTTFCSSTVSKPSFDSRELRLYGLTFTVYRSINHSYGILSWNPVHVFYTHRTMFFFYHTSYDNRSMASACIILCMAVRSFRARPTFDVFCNTFDLSTRIAKGVPPQCPVSVRSMSHGVMY